ncbi:G-protein coupled receptors family 1 profile domain-containing protein [Caenorhabditis elegans]|uniref:G-protein coupled receptors family 1 profile domain-containing protein n=1 Tax=Caenorhabditis elegans TaxID=6239 RepID=Q23305_CAEEL|nr:G-protein coupled receptors family 1 profile domain-containing protein [Caenorhabditis elegans]CAB01528.2 G-protein coupled receptors family 1 profile domain-containing protein [Caenorhabditis elegans]|eukprot:NP_506659.2 NeuroPeptide Receptor family [Caenorhabditis elegans]
MGDAESHHCIDVNAILQQFNDWTVLFEVRLGYSVLYFLILIIGLVGNGLLITSILMRKKLSVANIFLINLAVSDLLLCITAVPITPVLAFMKRWIFGIIMCKLVPTCQAFSVLISSWSLCYIAIDRYRSIVTPLREPWSDRHARWLLMFTWVVAFLASYPLYYSQNLKTMVIENVTLCGDFCGEFNWQSDEISKLTYTTSLLIIQLIIPAIIMSFCYLMILQKVQTDWLVDEGSMLTAAQQAQTAVRKRRVMYVLILMVIVFMACWFPLSAVNLFRDLGMRFEFCQTVYKVLMMDQMYFKLLNVHVIAMTSIVWNPVLYFWMSKRHRRALKDDMTWLTNARRHTNVGVLSRFTPSPSVSVVYRRTLERHLGVNHFRRGTLADPTCTSRERSLPRELQSNCFLLVPLMPLCQSVTRKNSHLAINRDGIVIPQANGSSRRPSSVNTNSTRDW